LVNPVSPEGILTEDCSKRTS